MNYSNFVSLLSEPRIGRYAVACNNDQKKTLALYRANIRLSQKVFSILSVFEVIIDGHYKSNYLPILGSEDWLLYSANPGGFYATAKTAMTQKSILKSVSELGANYSHNKLIAELNFGFWRFQFGSKEFCAAGSSLHNIFTNRPHGTSHTSIFNKLKFINNIRNRIAHHEPICFNAAGSSISTTYVTAHYNDIMELTSWLNIESKKLYFGVDTVQKEIDFINTL